MRTETDLKVAVEHLASEEPARQAASAARVMGRIRVGRPRSRVVPRVALAGAAAVAVVAAAVAITVPLTVPRQLAEPAARPSASSGGVSGDWQMVSTVRPPAGWVLGTRQIYADSEQSLLLPVGYHDLDVSCAVGFGRAGGRAPDSSSTPTTLGGRDGRYVPPGGTTGAQFWWTYASDSWASVICEGMRNPRSMIERVLPGVTLTTSDLKIPFTLSALPAGYAIRAVDQANHLTGSEHGIDLDRIDSTETMNFPVAVYRIDKPMFDPSAADVQSMTVVGRRAIYSPTSGPHEADATVCFSGRPTICASNWEGRGDSADTKTFLIELLSAVSPAADLNDVSDWPTASELPR